MAEADLNELLLMQNKDFDNEMKEYAMELYWDSISAEMCTAIMWENKHKKIDAEHKRMETL